MMYRGYGVSQINDSCGLDSDHKNELASLVLTQTENGNHCFHTSNSVLFLFNSMLAALVSPSVTVLENSFGLMT